MLMLAATASLWPATAGTAQAAPTIPTSGYYFHEVSAAENARFIGWGHIRHEQHLVPNPPTSIQAWRWSGAALQSTRVAFGDVYVYPYATGWSWVWRSSTGWLAVPSRDVIVGSDMRSCNVPSTTDMSYMNVCLGVYE